MLECIHLLAEDDTYYVDPVLQNHGPLSPGSSSSPGTRISIWDDLVIIDFSPNSDKLGVLHG